MQIAIICIENEIDGETFCDLKEDDLQKMFPNKLGVVKKLLKVTNIQVNMIIKLYMYILCTFLVH